MFIKVIVQYYKGFEGSFDVLVAEEASHVHCDLGWGGFLDEIGFVGRGLVFVT